MIIEKIKHNGNLVISDIINGQYIKKIYIGYSLTEAQKAFKQFIKGV